MRNAIRWLGLATVLLAACGGGEEGGGPPPKQGAPATPASPPAAAAAGSKSNLTKYRHVEDVVTAEERETIRHQFKERDFNFDPAGENRDPFQSFVIVLPGTAAATVETPVAPSDDLCRGKPLVAGSVSVRDLSISGIVLRGARRYALMQDKGGYGHIVTRGDCIGREKAHVKDIGAGYVTYEIAAETTPTGQSRPAEERSIRLYPSELPMNLGNESRDQGPDVVPVAPVAAPASEPAAPGPFPSPPPGNGGR